MTASRPRALTSADERETLWRADDVLAAAVPSAIGIVIWAVAWYQVSGQPSYGKQIGWADLAVGGLIVATTSQLLWFLRGRKMVGETRRRLLKLRVGPAVSKQQATIAVDEVLDGLVAGPHSAWDHRPSCPMARGRNWKERPRADLVAGGLTPCGVCRP